MKTLIHKLFGIDSDVYYIVWGIRDIDEDNQEPEIKPWVCQWWECSQHWVSCCGYVITNVKKYKKIRG